MSKIITLKQLKAEWVTPEKIAPYGQVIFPSKDDKIFDNEDAKLLLNNGIPRFYIMRLKQQGRKFHCITRHVKCTQCLGALEGKSWLIALAPPSQGNEPSVEDLIAFKIPGNCFVKLEVGTWHAGPHFDDDFIDFYNLELSDTNIVDHFTHNFQPSHGWEFEIV